MKKTKELDFEDAIEAYLLDHAGYTKADNSQFHTGLTLVTSNIDMCAINV